MQESTVDYLAHFRRYADAYERSLGDRVEADLIRSFFADDFLALSIAGGVSHGANDENFAKVLEEGYRFYKAIGTRGMKVEGVETRPIADMHDRVRVYYRAEYQKPDGAPASIDFDVTYLVQRTKEGAKIFAFIAGDEMALYRKHGLVDEDGKPARRG
ncbi:hypothetical protein [Aquamicrobium sp. LC103]|uniref:hypothetical protein n=1 Tax=Aquamicrobium sp. LC103 TaxID=1120658 RepID=UPI00063EB51B|nr:hypothetical protein [Aquamicrobium sp. LC103]TKT75048.1 nuclear transport factor 2 family protein [Aquamicrobium sp. LC103]